MMEGNRFDVLIIGAGEAGIPLAHDLAKAGKHVALAEEKARHKLLKTEFPEPGFEFLHKLRQVPGRADVPILALTGFGRPEDVERARAAGFYSHITKPFDLRHS